MSDSVETSAEAVGETLIEIIKIEAVNSEIDRLLAGQIINELSKLSSERDALAAQNEAQAAEIERLRSLINKKWEGRYWHGVSNGDVEEIIKGVLKGGSND